MRNSKGKQPIVSVEAKLFSDGCQRYEIIKSCNQLVTSEEAAEFLKGVASYIENFIQNNLSKEEVG